MKPMDQYDLPILMAAGFEAGFSGYSWFKKDRNGNEWQAYLDEKSVLSFRSNDGKHWGPSGPLGHADFERLFSEGE